MSDGDCQFPGCSEPWVGYIHDGAERMVRGCREHLELFQRDAEAKRELANTKARERNRGKRQQGTLFDEGDAATQGDHIRDWKSRAASDAGTGT